MIKFILVALFLIVLVSYLAYRFQENLLFFPHRLSPNYSFTFNHPFEEIKIDTKDERAVLNALLFSTKSVTSKGVIQYFHGNGGNIQGWGQTSTLYTNAGYDVLYYDYRGYGKSTGQIESEKQLIADGQLVYDYLKSKYNESEIILMGTSMGTGIAAQIAKNNNPSTLILHAPFYSLEDLIKEKMPVVPKKILKYTFRNDLILPQLNCDVLLVHGEHDHLIPPAHSRRLAALNGNSSLQIIPKVGHNNFFESALYQKKMTEYLNR